MPVIQVTQFKVQSYKIIHVVQDWVSGTEFSINFKIFFAPSFCLVRVRGLVLFNYAGASS